MLTGRTSSDFGLPSSKRSEFLNCADRLVLTRTNFSPSPAEDVVEAATFFFDAKLLQQPRIRTSSPTLTGVTAKVVIYEVIEEGRFPQ
jgi:hypothetical protein